MLAMRTLLVAAALALPSSASALTVDFTSLGTFTSPALNVGAVTVTGSAAINVSGTGLGIVGGNSSPAVDLFEFIDFTFAQLVLNVSYVTSFTLDTDNDFASGERTLEAFGIGGVSLGIAFGGIDVSGSYGNAAITRFRLLSFDNFGVGSVTFDLAPVPLPGALPLFASALGLGGLFGWRRKRKAALAAA